jgi:HEAT repeat protein
MRNKNMERVNKLLNISGNEWPRVIVAWSLMFLSRFGFIIGWTVLVATFLSKVGIELLPGLFLAKALVVMLGASLFRPLISRHRRDVMMAISIIGGAGLLLASIAFIESNIYLFFTLLLLGESMLLAQLNILISLFNEDLFSPLESQRTFPIIESAETLGGIAGGLTLSFLANVIPSYKFIIIWAIAILIIMPIALSFNTRTMEVPRLKGLENKSKNVTIRELKRQPFLKGLMLIVILHWGIMNMVEFQYTKAIQQNVYQTQEAQLVHESTPGAELEEGEIVMLASESASIGHEEQNQSNLQSSNIEETHSQNADLSSEKKNEYEQKLAQKLGFLHLIFNAVALLMQLILASRILTRFGVISTLLLHPVVTFINLIAMSLQFGFLSASLTRGAYEVTGLMFKNAYDSSYYAIPHEKRSDVKEVMQGLMKPIGAILGTGLLIIIAMNFEGPYATLAINLALITLTVIMAVQTSALSEKYTKLSEQNISRKNDLPTRLNAIDILGQKGHKKDCLDLQGLLRRKSEPDALKINVLHTLGERRNLESVNSILEELNADSDDVRLEAARSLQKFMNINWNAKNRVFTKQRILDELKNSLQTENNTEVRSIIVRLLHTLAPEELTNFLLQKIESKSSTDKANFIRMCKHFKDPNLKFYLQEFLSGKNVEEKAAAIEALWQFDEKAHELKHLLGQMLKSKRKKTLLCGIESAGRVQYHEAEQSLKKLTHSPDEQISRSALHALAQLNDSESINQTLEIMSDPSDPWFEESSSILATLHLQLPLISQSYKHKVYQKISDLISKNPSLNEMSRETMQHLYALYCKVNAHHEAHEIKMKLDSKEA